MLLLKQESAYIVIAGTIFSFLAFIFLYLGGILTYPPNALAFIRNASTWWQQFFSFLAMLLILVFSLGYVIDKLLSALEEKRVLFEKREEILEQLVKDRTSQLELATAQLIEQEKMLALGTMIKGVAHEFNTPLGIAITAQSYISDQLNRLQGKLESQCVHKEDLIGLLEALHEGGPLLEGALKRSSNLVTMLVNAYSHGVVDLRMKVELRPYIAGIIDSLGDLAPKPVAWSTHQIQDLTWEGDAQSLEQILRIVLVNALEHGIGSREGGAIEIIVTSEDTCIQIDVVDNGKGISEEDLPHIFEPFYTSQRGRNTGLGLNLAYSIIKNNLKGTITVRSNLNQGTQVTLQIPINPSEK